MKRQEASQRTSDIRKERIVTPTVLCSGERNPACGCDETLCRWWEYNRGHSWSVFRWLDQKEIVLHGRCDGKEEKQLLETDGVEGWRTGYIGGELCKVH